MTTRTRWLLAFALPPVLLAGIVSAVVATVDPDDFKPRLIAAVQDATGRTLSLDGPLRIRWSLWPTLQVNGARLANLPGGSRPDMARAERIEAQISLLALLLRRLDILQLRLVGPNVLFELVDGTPNWVFDTGPASGQPAQPPAAPFGVRVAAATVQNGMVTWHLPARTHVVGLRSFSLDHPREGAIDLDGTLVYGDNQPFDLRASTRATAGLHGPWQTGIDFAAFDTTAHAQGTMTLAGQYDLDVDVRSGALEKLNALLPALALPPVHGLAVSGHLASRATPGRLPVPGPLHVSLEAADLERLLPGLQLGRTELSLPAPDAAAQVTSQARFHGRTVGLAGTVRVPRQPEDRNDVPIALSAKAEGAALSLAGTVRTDRLMFAGLDAHASLRAPALAALRPLLTPAFPALNGVEFDGQVTIPADRRSVHVTAATLRTQEGNLAGTGSVELGVKTAGTIQARLSSTRIDLDAVLKAFGIELSSPAASGHSFKDTVLPWTTAGLPATDVSASVDTMTFQGETWRGVGLTLRRETGRDVADLQLAMPDGPARMSVSAGLSGRMPASVSVHAPGIPLALLAHYAGLPGAVTGSVRLDADLGGAGRTVQDFAASLQGPISVTMVGGGLTNAAFAKLAAGSLQPLGVTVPASGETVIRCFGLKGAAQGGVLHLSTIALDSTHLALSGTGDVDLARERLALKLHPLVEVGGSPVAVPVVVDGPFSAITGRLDATGLGKVGLLLDGLFGGDTPAICREAGLVPAQAAGTVGR